jgi:hypothetical protein
MFHDRPGSDEESDMKTMATWGRRLISDFGTIQKIPYEIKMIELTYNERIQNGNTSTRHNFPQMDFRSDAVYVVFGRTFEAISPKFSEMFAVCADEVCDDRFNPLTLVAPEYRRWILERYRKGIRDESDISYPQHFEFKGLTINGSRMDCGTVAVFIPYKWGVAMHGIVWDMAQYDPLSEERMHYSQQIAVAEASHS